MEIIEAIAPGPSSAALRREKQKAAGMDADGFP
jgi:hypothetical protein